MRITTYALPAGALALGALLLTPTESQGYSTIGGKLGTQTQRDVRIYNNFSDAQANNNNTPDANWPGYVGAPLAIWKACSEWGSEPHNLNGAGDPLQTVGSGNANFDITWQGEATSVGGSNNNIHSEISGGSGGTLAYTETPISDGWRIRYYAAWTWQDGPGNNGGMDLQGVACHEYGHALGLGHSSTFSATMYPSISGSGTGARSIANDDIAGLQFIYSGPTDPNKKPHISDVFQQGGVLYLSGTKFDLTPGNNEVWFTQAGTGGNGTAVKVTGLDSNGTQIVCPIPANAGPGDIVVRNQSISGPKGMSNQMAFDPQGSCAGNIQTYCTAGVTASGCTASISGNGTPSASASSGFTIDVAGSEGDKDGLIFFGENGRQANSWGSSSSFQCVVPPVKRSGIQAGVGTSGACDGGFSLDFNAYIAANPQKSPGVGAVVQAQSWFRDPQNTSNQTTSLSDALEFVLCE